MAYAKPNHDTPAYATAVPMVDIEACAGGGYFSRLDDLFAFLGVDAHAQDFVSATFAIKVPYAFAQKMQPRLDDPLLLQVLPAPVGETVQADFIDEPLSEQDFTVAKGVLHKYKNRVLLTLTGACIVHCQYCFRQNFAYSDNLADKDTQHFLQQYIARHDIDEIILSGGDPLSLSRRRVQDWCDFLAKTAIGTVRIHTRAPVMDAVACMHFVPILQNLAQYKKVVLVLHINHAQEIDDNLAKFCNQLRGFVHILNQSVLLKGVNDSANVLAKLSQALFDIGVLPYYLHRLDKVKGAQRFWVDEINARQIYWQLLAQLSGYLVPKFVVELPHEAHKMPIDLYAN